MTLDVFGNVFRANGTPEELSLYSAMLVNMMKAIQDGKDNKEIEAEIKSLWDSLKGGGDE